MRAMFTVPAGQRVFGLQLPVQSHSRSFAEDWELHAGPPELVQLAQACERGGYAYIGVCDHVTLPESVSQTMSTFWVDPIATLGYLAAVTERIMLLTHVYVLPYRRAEIAAKQFATLDYLSNGRFIAGIGAGHVQAEFERLGVDFRHRGQAVADGVAALEALLTAEYVDGFGARPRPVQTPRPPVWIAGSSTAAVKRAGRLADGWLPQGPATEELIDLLLDSRAAAGRSDDIVIGHITPMIHVGTPSYELPDHVISGSAASIVDRLAATSPSRANQLQVRFRGHSCAEVCEQIERFAAEVMPHLQSM